MLNMEFYYKNGETMDIGFIGFGKVNQTLANKLTKQYKTYVSIENRSEETIKRIKQTETIKLDSNKQLMEKCDIIISANSPKNALNVAKQFSNYEGLYLDLNNINPTTTLKIEQIFSNNFIDGAIIGKVENLKLLILSGPKSKKLSIFKNCNIKTNIISDKIGDASKLKMLRSIYTKGVSALLIETFENANNLSSQLWDILEITENTDFKSSSTSRIKNSKKNKKRKNEELNEILNFLKNQNSSTNNLIMTEATKNKFEKL